MASPPTHPRRAHRGASLAVLAASLALAGCHSTLLEPTTEVAQQGRVRVDAAPLAGTPGPLAVWADPLAGALFADLDDSSRSWFTDRMKQGASGGIAAFRFSLPERVAPDGEELVILDALSLLLHGDDDSGSNAPDGAEPNGVHE